MTDINGAGGGSFGGLSDSVSGQTQWWRPTLDTADGWVSPTVTPIIFTQQDSFDGSSADVQLQVSAVDTFATTVHDSDLAQNHNTSVGRQVTGLSDGNTYYLRARVKKTIGGYNYVSQWSTTHSFSVITYAGIATMNATMNIGVAHTPSEVSPAYLYFNIGVEHLPDDGGYAYVYQNVGIETIPVDFTPQYVFQGDVNTATPDPFIWFLLPNYGRESDGIAIVGFGFGDLQGTYNGVVEIDWGGDIGWQAVSVVSWQTFPPTSDAYTGNRHIDEMLGSLDPQHTVVQIQIPTGAIPPGYPVRVRTDGP